MLKSQNNEPKQRAKTTSQNKGPAENSFTPSREKQQLRQDAADADKGLGKNWHMKELKRRRNEYVTCG
jgi:hypothetical protein